MAVRRDVKDDSSFRHFFLTLTVLSIFINAITIAIYLILNYLCKCFSINQNIKSKTDEKQSWLKINQRIIGYSE